jgi:hypothetical protein
MNIFYLSFNTKKCARYHLDRHVVKMILELAQLLCTAIWLSGKEAPYKATHKNHPSAIWTRDNINNWKWTKKLALALCKEYTYRYGKKHKSEDIIKNLETPDLPNGSFYQPLQAMPDQYKNEDSLIAYRNYYTFGKKHLHEFKNRHAWKKRNIPNFILKNYPEYSKYEKISIEFL